MSENSGKIDLIYDLLKTVDAKNDEQNQRLAKLEVNTDRNTDDLKEHIRRTDLLEKSLNNTKSAISKKIAEIEEPKKTVKNVGQFLKWSFGIIGVVAGAVFGILRLYKIL
jgi:hypothetical protein